MKYPANLKSALAAARKVAGERGEWLEKGAALDARIMSTVAERESALAC